RRSARLGWRAPHRTHRMATLTETIPMNALQTRTRPAHGARALRPVRSRTRARCLAAVAVLALAPAACGVRPAHVHLGADECAHCRMVITDRRFAAQLLTDRGRSYLFDSIECLAAF